MLTLSVRKPDVQKALQELVATTEQKIKLVMEAVAVETIAYLKSFQADRKPPHKTVPPPPGPYHPGGWRDITSQLVNSYGWEINPIDGGVRLVLKNDAEYAVYLEHRDGFFVLSGVTDPGGPVEQALIEVCAQIAPEFQVVRGG